MKNLLKTLMIIMYGSIPFLQSCEKPKAEPQVDLANGLLAYFPFTGNANDATGNGNNGTVYGATLTSDKSGNPNSAYSFDGVTNYIVSTNINLNAAASISVWVYPIGSNGALVDKDNDAM